VLVSLVVAVAAVVLVAAVAAVLLLRGDDSADSASGPLKTPLRFLPVLAETPGSCSGAGTPSSDHRTCYRTDPAGMTVTRVRSIEVMSPDHEHGSAYWGIDLTLEPSDARAFEQLSAKAAAAGPEQPGNRIAMVVGGVVVSAPTVAQAITGGRVQIVGAFDKPAAERLFHQLTGAG
jgi:preprotein translocase subunit SecD